MFTEVFYMNINAQNKQSRGGVPAVRRTAHLPSGMNESDDTPLMAVILKSSAIGTLATLLSGLLLITLSTVIAYSNPDPDSLVLPLALLSLLPSCFIGGLITFKLTGASPVLCGVMCGAITTLIMMLFSLVLYAAPSSSYSFWQSLLLHLAAVGFCILGGLAGNAKPKLKKGKKRFGN